MADLLKYRYTGSRDSAGVPLQYLAHPLYGGIPARDLYQSDVSGMHEEQVAMLNGSPLYEKVNQGAARDEAKERMADDPAVTDGNVSSPGLPEEQRTQVAPPGSAAAGPMGAVVEGPATDAEAQMRVDAESAASNPAIQDNPPAPRRGGRK
jgi:hypothetical protein